MLLYDHKLYRTANLAYRLKYKFYFTIAVINSNCAQNVYLINEFITTVYSYTFILEEKVNK